MSYDIEKIKSDFERALSESPESLERVHLFNEKLNLLAKAAGGPRRLAALTGISVSGLNRYLNGGEPTLSKLQQISEGTDFTIQWLANDELPMRTWHSTGSGKTKTSMAAMQYLLKDQPAEYNPMEFASEFALIPGYNVEVAAGDGAFPEQEEPTRKLAFRHKWLKFRGLKPESLVLVFATGDSMEPTISDNNTLMIDTSQRDLNDGQIYVIRTDGHLIVKRIQKLWNKGILLLSDNKEYKEQQVEPNEADDLEVIGRVVWIGKDV